MRQRLPQESEFQPYLLELDVCTCTRASAALALHSEGGPFGDNGIRSILVSYLAQGRVAFVLGLIMLKLHFVEGITFSKSDSRPP